MKTKSREAAGPQLVQIQPNPTRLRTRIADPDTVASFRRLECRAYDRCLDHAARAGWASFHCNSCQAFEQLTAAERRRDHIAILEMLEETQLLPSLLEPDVLLDEESEDPPDAPVRRVFLPDPEDTDASGR